MVTAVVVRKAQLISCVYFRSQAFFDSYDLQPLHGTVIILLYQLSPYSSETKLKRVGTAETS